jgi:hypothetical protein
LGPRSLPQPMTPADCPQRDALRRKTSVAEAKSGGSATSLALETTRPDNDRTPV